jgi:hypothetical protein
MGRAARRCWASRSAPRSRWCCPTLHHLTPDDRHGEALAFRSMTINMSQHRHAAGLRRGAGRRRRRSRVAVDGGGAWQARRLR